ncbi:hypothetical protein FIBSPDRAFT_424876 [Athelia psychrophila]|uniref:Uncharacterized protein n=1 Tax=Athelia psychrophila TaxID=1759441 RepID=A0A167UP71_9AGAM|nr:hypothetical protein FIBSPDRAFT_424876 [Fibularhizoctonia sp. CBS 109695]
MPRRDSIPLWAFRRPWHLLTCSSTGNAIFKPSYKTRKSTQPHHPFPFPRRHFWSLRVCGSHQSRRRVFLGCTPQHPHLHHQ